MDCAVLTACLASLGLYLNTLDADFAYDDSRAIQKNPDLLPETPLVNLLYDDFWGTPLTHSGSHKSYRPLCVLTFRLNYALGKLSPWGYHLGNILLHALVTAVFTCFARKLLRRTFPTYVAGLLFATHPIHTEAVAGIVGRADIGACLFFLLTLLSYMKYVEVRKSTSNLRWVFAVCVVLFTVASLLTKEQAIAVLAVCATYDVFVFHRVQVQEILHLHIFTQARLRSLCEGLVLLGSCGVSLVALRVYFMGNKPPEFAPSDNPASDSDSLVTRVLTYNFLPALNIWLLLCPAVLSFDWSMESVPLVENVTDFRNIFTLVMYLSIAYFAKFILKNLHQKSSNTNGYNGYKVHMNGNGVHHNGHNGKIHTYTNLTRLKGRESSSSSDNEEYLSPPSDSMQQVNVCIISLAIIIFPFIPASNLFFYVGFVIAERILYIPSMGFCLLVALGVDTLYRKRRTNKERHCVVAAVTVILALFSARTFTRNWDWLTEEQLYTAGVRVNPAKAWGNLANVWNEQGRTADAEEAYRSALHHRGNMADVHYNLGILLQDQKRISEALESYHRAIHYRPKLSMAHLNLGILTAQQGNNDNAAQIYRHCADLDTSGLKDPRLHESTKISCLYNLGRLLTEEEKFQEALVVYEEALRRRPPHYTPQSLYNMMGEVYSKMGELEVAEKWYREALKSKSDHVPAHLTMAKLMLRKKLYEEAERWFKLAAEIDQKDSSIDHHYAQFLSEMGRHIEAEERYRLAVAKGNADFELLFNAANAYRQNGKDHDAEDLYRRAAVLKPELPSAHMNLGAILHINGKLEEAEKSYLAALALKPDDAMTTANLHKLRNLMSPDRKGAS